jgi:suppressor of fused-like protein
VAHAPGWDAIDVALARLYPGVVPVHLAPFPGAHMPGGGVQGISAYPAEDHWHLVTYGLSELFEKVSRQPEISGWGYELTIRAAREPDDEEAPQWAFNLLERLARVTQADKHRYRVGDRIELGGPLDGQPETRIVALTVVVDTQLGTIVTPNGAVQFRQVVGITANELDFLRAGSVELVLEHLTEGNPLLVTDVRR